MVAARADAATARRVKVKRNREERGDEGGNGTPLHSNASAREERGYAYGDAYCRQNKKRGAEVRSRTRHGPADRADRAQSPRCLCTDLSGPLRCVFVVRLAVLFKQLCDFGHQRIVRVGVSEEGADGEEDL